MSHKEEQTTVTVYTIEPPKKYAVILHNDHYSTWEFVIDVLKKVFRKTENEAVQITSDVHNKGFAVCGEYSYEIAEMKVMQVHAMAKANGYPLKSTMQEA